MVGVRVWIPSTVRASERAVQYLRLRAPDGHLFPVKRVARFTVLTGQPQIRRDDLKRMIAVTGRISGRDLGSDPRRYRHPPAFGSRPPRRVLQFGRTLRSTTGRVRRAHRRVCCRCGTSVLLCFSTNASVSRWRC